MAVHALIMFYRGRLLDFMFLNMDNVFCRLSIYLELEGFSVELMVMRIGVM